MATGHLNSTIIIPLTVARKKTREASEAQMKVVRGRRGRLENLPTMPVDILIEIMTHLRPLDILNLSRTNKAFRRLLMTRATGFVWKRARGNVEGLPPCPDDLDEPAYANLAFDTQCYACTASGVKMVLWELRVRYCPSCRKKKFRCRSTIVKQYPALSELSSWKFNVLFPSIPYGYRGNLYHMPDVEAYAETFSQEESGFEFEDLALTSKAWRSRPEMQPRLEHAKLCAKWHEKLKDERKEELQAIRDRRCTEIMARLTVLGWGAELEFMEDCDWDELINHPRVTESKKLTDGMWEKMLPELVEILDKVRECRVTCEHRLLLASRLGFFNEFYAEWRRSQGPDAILPQAIDLANHAELREIVTVPDEFTVTKSSFETLNEVLPSWVDQWRQDCDSTLAANLDGTCSVNLDLATTAWICRCCSWPPIVYHYPEILEHRCLYERVMDQALKEYAHSDVWEFLIRLVNEREQWSYLKCLSVKQAPAWAADVVQACGMDPATATARDMDKLDVRLVCKKCMGTKATSPVHAMKVYSWRAAIQHYFRGHCTGDIDFITAGMVKLNIPLEWERLDEDCLSSVKKIEDTAMVFYNPQNAHLFPTISRAEQRSMCCAYCPQGHMSVEEAKLHLNEYHCKFDDNEAGIDYYHDKSLGPLVPSPVILVPEPSVQTELQEDFKDDPVAEEAVKWITDGRAGFLQRS